MTQSEFEQIVQLLDDIRMVAYDKYETKYMPRFNSLGGKQMHSLPYPIAYEGSITINDLNEAIQATNVAYVYQLNNTITCKAALVQWIHDRYSFEEKIIDGVNYMGSLTNAMYSDGSIPQIPLNAAMKDVVNTLQEILKLLQQL